LLHEEGKLNEKSGCSGGEIKAMAGEHRRKAKGPRCHNCHRFGHIKKDCRELARSSIDSVHKKEKRTKENIRHIERRGNEETTAAQTVTLAWF